MHASAVVHSKGHMSLKKLQGPLPGVKREDGTRKIMVERVGVIKR